jgi:eukaryotic-like serine/threonine-protein kinase
MELPVRVGAVIDEKYRVDAFLGSGAMSVVAAAYHLELEQPVAIKFLRAPGFDQVQTTQRFKREARAAARIKSEHVVRVLDVGALPDGCPYIVMEHLAGRDLGRELAERGRLPATEAAGYLLEACEALAEAHAVGIVHRDLKPENLFLAERSDGTRVVKLLDFGISKSGIGNSLTDLALTRTATFMGSPLYMSPEQMRSPRSVDARSDIWSLGAIFYEALSGKLPFNAESIPELCLSVVSDEPPSLSQLVPELSPELVAIVGRCLEKDRDKRYPSVAQLAVELVPFAPREASTAERTKRILDLPSPIAPLKAPEPARATRVSSLTSPIPPGTVPDSLTPMSQLRSEGVTVTAERPRAKWRAPLWVAIAAVVALAAIALLREPSTNASVISAARPAPRPAAVPDEAFQPRPEPELRAPPAIADSVAAPEPSVRTDRPNRRAPRAPRSSGSAAATGPAASPASSRAPNAWDASEFGGRY